METYKNKEVLEKYYNEYKSVYKVAEQLNANHKTISAWMDKFGLSRQGSQGARKNHLNHDYFENIDTEEKAYWLGFIMADGCVYKGNDKHSYRLQINLKGSDLEHLDKFQEAIGSSYKIQQKKVKNADVCLLKVNSTKLCKDLMNLNVIPRKSLVCEMPVIREELKRHFIRGYFDGDGCLDYTHGKLPRARIFGGEAMMSTFQEEMKKNNIASNLYGPSKNNKIHSLELTDSSQALKFASWLYDNSTVSLNRKLKIYESYL